MSRTSTDAPDHDMVSLVIQGNIAVPTGNPFDPTIIAEFEGSTEADPDCVWLGPGLKLLLDHVLAVDENGIILWLAPATSSRQVVQQASQVIRLDPFLEFLCPGMIDTHIHAPQFAFTGTATDRPLMGPNGWLDHYTFPAEARLYDDPELARQVYRGVVKTTLKSGTTTAVYFGTLHLRPNQILVDVALDLGQRALVGKVCMDRNAPPNYVQTLEQNVQETVQLMEYIDTHPNNPGPRPRVLPLIAPRFIPTCTPQLLTALGKLAAQHNCHITSHISESLDEVEWSRQLDRQDFGWERTDAAVFHSHHLLTDCCIMAHGVHLSSQDATLLRQQGTAIAHCPRSNLVFAGGILDCQRLLRQNNKVSLGTDVAGGSSPSMMDSVRMAVVASQSWQIHHPTHAHPKPMDYRQAIYLATLAGAHALNLQDRIGTLAVGMELDAMVLSAKGDTVVSVFPGQDTLADVFQKLWVLGDDRNVSKVFVQGREVKQALP